MCIDRLQASVNWPEIELAALAGDEW